MIRATALTKYYGPRKALDGFTAEIAAGEIIGLVGKNGAGKSTVLRILSGQLLPTAGEVSVHGHPVTEQPGQVRRHIGFLPEEPPLYPEMRVRAYLSFAARLRGVSGAAAPAAVAHAAAVTGLHDVLTERVGTLSRGYQQRVGIAQAIVHDPPVVLLDEPMAGLDPLQITHIRALIRGLKPRHTVLFSSHILSEITNVCDRVLLIDRGRVRAEGSEAELWRAFHERERLYLTLRGAEATARAALTAVEGVALEALEPAPDGALAVTLAAPATAREAISHACVQAGLGLRELRGERHGLEELFIHLLGDDAA